MESSSTITLTTPCMAVSVNEGGNTLENFYTLLIGDMIRFHDSHEWMLKSHYVEL